jgi:RNA polymerase sigma-70 factor (ECF subfamily)
MVTQTHAAESMFFSADDDHRTFIELYNTYFSRVYSYVHYRVNNFHDADDLTSQIFTKLFTNYKHYKPEKAPFSVWIFTIARNTLTDYYRGRVRHTYASLEETAELTDNEFDLDDYVYSKEISRHLHSALALLSPREREIIALKFWSGCTNRDIAKFMGISESNTGVILFRAMRRLRHILESRGVHIVE